MIQEEIINKFLENKATSEEAEAVAQYFRENPKELDYYLNKKEWDDANIDVLPPKIEMELDNAILEKKKSKTLLLKCTKNGEPTIVHKQ